MMKLKIMCIIQETKEESLVPGKGMLRFVKQVVVIKVKVMTHLKEIENNQIYFDRVAKVRQDQRLLRCLLDRSMDILCVNWY